MYVFYSCRNEDLLVGAPYYAVNINEGAVYAYVNTGNVSYDLFDHANCLLNCSKYISENSWKLLAFAGRSSFKQILKAFYRYRTTK